jgi:hypothetical protein
MPSPFADTATRRDGRPLTPHPASYFLHAHLLAHELTHVVQHEEGRLGGSSSDEGMDVSSPDDWFEVEGGIGSTNAQVQVPEKFTYSHLCDVAAGLARRGDQP